MNTRKAILLLLSLVLIWAVPVYTQGIHQDGPMDPNNPFQANVLIVEPPTDPGRLEAYSNFLNQIEISYNISIETRSLTPNAEQLGTRVLEKHFWPEDVGCQTTREIRDQYEAAGYTAYLSHLYRTAQHQVRNVRKNPYGEVPPNGDTDELMVHQIPYPLGEDDMSGFPDNEGGYLRARYACWPPAQGPQEVVLLVLSDTGLYWRYEDFIANLWQNPGEDIDGDGQTIVDLGNGEYEFDLDDLNNQDDDGHGYDDLIGWDFVGQSPDPTHYDGEYFTHGTSVYSVLASETYNGRDLAGVLYPGYVKVVPTKVGAGIWIYEAEAIEGIYYACALLSQGYKVVLSMSWGGSYASQPLEEALDFFWSMGGASFAAVGNWPDGQKRYPAGYDHVIAVAATTNQNVRWELSNFGFWVDVAAPGHQIWCAFYFAEMGGFIRMYFGPLDGTSFACPHVAGGAAMLWSTQPGLTNAELKERVRAAVYTPEDYPWDDPNTWPNDTYFLGGGPPQWGRPYYGEGIFDIKLLFEPGGGN